MEASLAQQTHTQGMLLCKPTTRQKKEQEEDWLYGTTAEKKAKKAQQASKHRLRAHDRPARAASAVELHRAWFEDKQDFYDRVYHLNTESYRESKRVQLSVSILQGLANVNCPSPYTSKCLPQTIMFLLKKKNQLALR
eukprot:TRINITY_DN55735_c0_g1_i1.p1 TRINITY_DN55735_c0_g1~~TRINITY_DN55735_c0_g1_i1.p1  ORF type:complete len:153 (-),score=12.09 TRINITY_DN55735_c0_g1_i1:100-513(-)